MTIVPSHTILASNHPIALGGGNRSKDVAYAKTAKVSPELILLTYSLVQAISSIDVP